ncbi:hypothetical protein HMI55_001068 [Coelomomyces lativittatus]|nr:hypothetical protein HMI55_001068 [Coelomomyces lativittatus]
MVVGEESTSPARMASPSAGIYSSANASIRVGTASEASGPTSGGGHRSKFHPVTFHHSHFNKNIEKENLSMTQLKQALFPNALNNSGTDQAVRMSDIRVGPIYLGEKVFMRTGSGTLTRDSRAIALEKVKRRELVNRTGFSSSNHETYKPLGEPILEAEKLISTSLNISITPGPL